MAKRGTQTVGRNTVAGRALLEGIERIERIREAKKQLSEDEKLEMQTLSAAGYNTKTIRTVIQRRAMKPADLEEAQSNLDMYLHAIGMAHETPLFRAVGMMSVDLAARDEVIEAFKLLVPASGEIIVKVGAQPVRLWRDDMGVAHAEDIEDKPAPASTPKRASGATERPKRDVPDVDEAGARELGRLAYHGNEPITSNPFPWDDKRRAVFDQGWREASGTDGMGPED